MAKARMDLTAFVGKLLAERGRAAGMDPGALPGADGNRGRRPDRGQAPRAHGRARGLSQREPNAHVGYADGHDRAGDPEGDALHLRSVVTPAAPAGRARLRRRAGSVRARRLDAKGRCPGQGSWRGRDLNVGGLADLRGTRHGGVGVSDAPVDGATSVSLGGCDVPQGPRGRPGYQPRHGAGCISCGIYWPRCRTGCGRRSRPSSARSLRSRTTPRR